MEYITAIFKRVKPFISILTFIVVFTVVFMLVTGTLKYTIPFIIGIIAASILEKPTEALIKRFNMRGEIAAIVSTLVFYAITVTLVVLGIIYFSSEIKNLATDAYGYVYGDGTKVGNLVQSFLSTFESIDQSVLDTLKSNITKLVSDASNYVLKFSGDIVNYIFNIISALPYIISVIIFAILSSFVFLKKFIEKNYSQNQEKKLKEEGEYDKYIAIIFEIKDVVFKYIGTYSFLVFCTFIITFIGFSILKIPYTLLLSFLCMLLDLLPIVGMILVFLPLVVIYLFSGKYVTVIFLLILFSVIMITRNILEPKLLSSSLELSQISVLISIFVGLNAGGFKGMIYLIALFIGFNFYKKYAKGQGGLINRTDKIKTEEQ